MNDTEIKILIQDILLRAGGDFSLYYRGPIVLGGGHSLEIESKTCLGAISVWASGIMDWHVFDIATSAEVLLGCSEVKDIDAVQECFLAIFEEIRGLDQKTGTPTFG